MVAPAPPSPPSPSPSPPHLAVTALSAGPLYVEKGRQDLCWVKLCSVRGTSIQKGWQDLCWVKPCSVCGTSIEKGRQDDPICAG